MLLALMQHFEHSFTEKDKVLHQTNVSWSCPWPTLSVVE